MAEVDKTILDSLDGMALKIVLIEPGDLSVVGEILEYLEKNARIPFTEIAKKLNISETAIRKRVKKLEDENVILGYKASVNYKKLGYSNKVVMGVDCESKEYFKVMNALKEMEEVKNLNASSGDHMIMFDVWVKNMNDLNEVLEKVNSISGVTQSCPSILQDVMKE